jgi:cytochrome c biogenesis protein CcmG, thiol:disulfide interchange protein DsbE
MKGLAFLKFLLPLAGFAVIAAFLYKGLWMDPREIPSPLIGKPAPDFDLPAVDDPARRISRKDMLGKVWIFNAWASWCVACREEHPVLVEFSKQGMVTIIGLDYKDTRAEGGRWLSQFGNPYQASVFDEKGLVGIDYGVTGVPETFVVDKEGIVRYKKSGPVTPELLQGTLVPLIKKLNA